jgi:hypothetical protein
MPCYGLTGFLSAALLAQPPQPPLFVTMTANQPLVAAWLSAPSGTSTAIATQPAGALPATSYLLEGGDGTNARIRMLCERQVLGTSYLQLRFQVHALQPVNELLVTTADVTYRIAAPVGTVLNIRAMGGSLQGCSDGNAIWVDLDDDGTIDFDSGTDNHRIVTRTASVVPMAIRVRSNWIAPQFPCSFGCLILVETWHPAAQPAGPGCDNLAAPNPPPHSWPHIITTNYQMAAAPSDNPHFWLDLRAYGYGNAGWFLFDSQTATTAVTLPSPWGITCPVLSNPFTAIPAGISADVPYWARMLLPFLPPGNVVHVQHAAFSLQNPFRFGTSNRIRLQS